MHNKGRAGISSTPFVVVICKARIHFDLFHDNQRAASPFGHSFLYPTETTLNNPTHYLYRHHQRPEIYRDSDATLRSYTEVRDLWSSRGIDATKGLIFYCGGGYRSSLTNFYAYLIGYTGIRNYSDGWSGWSTTYTEDPTYVKDPLVPGSTTGWRQDPSGMAFATGGL